MEQEIKHSSPPAKEPRPLGQKAARLAHAIARPLLWSVLALVSLAALTSVALAWRLSRGPLDASAVIPVIEKMASARGRLEYRIGALTLARASRTEPLLMQLDDVRLVGPRGEFLNITHVDLGVSTWRLLLAQLHFRYAKVQNLSMRLIRLPDGVLTLTGADENRKTAGAISLDMDRIVHDLPAIDRFTLTDMRVIFEDQKNASVRRFDNVDIEMTQETGLEGRSITGYLTATLTGLSEGSRATFDFIYDAADKTLTANAALDGADMRRLFGSTLRQAGLPLIDMQVNGRAEVRLKNNFMPDYFSLRLKGDDGMLLWPRNYGEGLENQKLTKFEVDLGLDPKTQQLTLDNATITIKGITLVVTGGIAATNGWNNLSGTLVAQTPVVAVDVLPAVWPSVWSDGARKWLVDRMDKGRFSNVRVELPFTALRKTVTPQGAAEPEYGWDVRTGKIKATFGFTGVSVDYRPPMIPVRDTTGTGVYEGLSLALDFTRAAIGKLAVSGGHMEFDDLITPGTGTAKLSMTMKGPVSGVFEYLDREPIAYRKKVSVDGSRARGQAELGVGVGFPLTHDMKVADVHIKADARLRGLVMPGAVKGMDLAGPDFKLEASENHFSISGKGSLEGQPATLAWTEYFSPKPGDAFASKLEADLSTSKEIRKRFLGTLEDRVTGTIPARVSMLTTPGGRGTLKVEAVLDAARIDFTDPFNAIKEQGRPSTLTLAATLQNGFIKSIDTLAARGAGLSFNGGGAVFGRDSGNEAVLSKVVLKGFRLGRTEADISAEWPTVKSLKASVNGESFDARAVLGDDRGKGGAGPSAYDVSLNIKNLYVAEAPLTNVRGRFIGNADKTMRLAELEATAGKGALGLHYDASGDQNDALSLTAADAGGALAALGITQRVRGGVLRVEGAPMDKGRPGDMRGTLRIDNFSVVNAPVLAKLINLLSVPGLLGILTADTGLHFNRAESDLVWLNREGGGLARFEQGRTSGASLGLTFEGEIDTAKDRVNIQGTAIPMSEINGLLAKIPLVGALLTGGNKGSGIFAATYSVKGPSADPDVSVNPLSVLTPGILRRLLFEGGLTGK